MIRVLVAVKRNTKSAVGKQVNKKFENAVQFDSEFALHFFVEFSDIM